MIPYKHFAVPNLFLENGYVEIHSQDGIEREYEQEDALEQCVRRILLRNPQSLRGWDLRFLRNGLGISQSEFGQMVDRDAQTIARWEKSSEPIPKFADVMIRIRFAEKFEPTLGINEVLSFSDGTAQPLTSQITLTLSAKGWSFNLGSSVKLPAFEIIANTCATLPRGFGPTLKILEGRRSTTSRYFTANDYPAVAALNSPMMVYVHGDLAQLDLSSDTTASLPSQGYFDEHTRHYAH